MAEGRTQNVNEMRLDEKEKLRKMNRWRMDDYRCMDEWINK